jgi:hypothetical protein
VLTDSAITTRLVDTVTTPMLLKLALSGKLDPSKLITHSECFMQAKWVFANLDRIRIQGRGRSVRYFWSGIEARGVESAHRV